MSIATASLSAQIAAAASSFADEVVAVVRSASLREISALVPRSAAHPPRANGAAKQHLSAAKNFGTRPNGEPRKRAWPTCGIPSCKAPFYPLSAKGGKPRRCFKHFTRAGGKLPAGFRPKAKAKPAAKAKKSNGASARAAA